MASAYPFGLPVFPPSITDNDYNYLPHAPELTEALLFHSRLISLNLGVVDLDKYADNRQGSSSVHQVNDLSISLEPIITERNALVPDLDITNLLDKSKPAPEGVLDSVIPEAEKPSSPSQVKKIN